DGVDLRVQGLQVSEVVLGDSTRDGVRHRSLILGCGDRCCDGTDFRAATPEPSCVLVTDDDVDAVMPRHRGRHEVWLGDGCCCARKETRRRLGPGTAVEGGGRMEFATEVAQHQRVAVALEATATRWCGHSVAGLTEYIQDRLARGDRPSTDLGV